jgi:hypothetical protein
MDRMQMMIMASLTSQGKLVVNSVNPATICPKTQSRRDIRNRVAIAIQ